MYVTPKKLSLPDLTENQPMRERSIPVLNGTSEYSTVGQECSVKVVSSQHTPPSRASAEHSVLSPITAYLRLITEHSPLYGAALRYNPTSTAFPRMCVFI